MAYSASIQKIPRRLLPADFRLTDWASVSPYFDRLLQAEIGSLPELEDWLLQLSELEAAVSEDACWRQIRMTCDTENKSLEEAFAFYCNSIQPHVQAASDALNRKLIHHPLTARLDAAQYHTYLRGIRKNIELFREQNIPLQSELSVLEQQFGAISGRMTVTVDGQVFTLQQAAKFLEHEDRNKREEVYRKINERRMQDSEPLHALFNQLCEKRMQVAINAGFDSYTDYRFRELGRFDYTAADCQAFHEAVRSEVLPLVADIYRRKRAKLGLEKLRPWDLEAEPPGTKPLRPFTGSDELIDKTIRCFNKLRPFFGDCLSTMRGMRHLDLESRKGKAPGGYNCPLPESGAPFIFMNAAGQMQDVVTMVHEGGHAVHSFLAHPLPLSGFKEYPMEIAEVASMSMELFSMAHWDVFFPDPAACRRARIHLLERIITLFPWIALIDKFQHWIYAHPQHTDAQRSETWMALLQEFSEGMVDFSGLDNYRANSWQKQLHLFEVPFYYIEYGIAQLGAIGMWMQFKEDREAALDNYCRALSLGGTATLPELFRTAGLSFDFSADAIRKLMRFVREELEALEASA
jgi:oligoendopeptidase F